MGSVILSVISIGIVMRFFPMHTPALQNRRQFFRTAAPFIVSASTLGHAGAVSPNGKVRLACIGVGGQGTGNLLETGSGKRGQCAIP